VQDLYQIMVQVSTYDSMGRSSKEVLSNEVYASIPSQRPRKPSVAVACLSPRLSWFDSC
jgi:hypothetical protein